MATLKFFTCQPVIYRKRRDISRRDGSGQCLPKYRISYGSAPDTTLVIINAFIINSITPMEMVFTKPDGFKS